MKTRKFNFDYSKTLWMKMYLADPDFQHGVSDVHITFEQALELIKTVDALTQGIQKIVYLVGWQGLGHDDCYPEMHTFNDALKRACDKSGKESVWWLFEEAKKYHTVVSFHGNLADEYAANASHEEIVKANAVVNGLDGAPAVIEVFNGRDAYKISYKQYYESGLFRKYWDKFCEATPVREAGTVHLDNFCIAESLNPRTTVEEQDEARNRMLDEIIAMGIDVTSEYTYREQLWRADSPEHPIRRFYATAKPDLPVGDRVGAPIRTLGRIPATWWTSGMTAQECIDIPPALYSGLLTDLALRNVFYGELHGEDIWMKHGIQNKNWVPPFLEGFCTLFLPYRYLNRYVRLRIEEDPGAAKDERYTAYFSDGIVSCGKGCTITKNGVTLKREGDVILPLTEDNKTFVAYSAKGRNDLWNLPDAAFTRAKAYEITAEGNVFLQDVELKDKALTLSLKPGQAVVIRA